MTDVLKGTLDLMILKGLSWGPAHGFGLSKWIRATSDGTLDIDDGALYPALHRLVGRGWISAEWGVSQNRRKARYYKLTARGRRQLDVEIAGWERFAAAMGRIVGATS